MRKRDTWLWVIYGFVLLFLYLISSTNLLIKERKNEIYPVSVILDDTTDESYQNFKKGVDRAAIELNADVSMITLYEGGDAKHFRLFGIMFCVCFSMIHLTSLLAHDIISKD